MNQAYRPRSAENQEPSTNVTKNTKENSWLLVFVTTHLLECIAAGTHKPRILQIFVSFVRFVVNSHSSRNGFALQCPDGALTERRSTDTIAKPASLRTCRGGWIFYPFPL